MTTAFKSALFYSSHPIKHLLSSFFSPPAYDLEIHINTASSTVLYILTSPDKKKGRGSWERLCILLQKSFRHLRCIKGVWHMAEADLFHSRHSDLSQQALVTLMMASITFKCPSKPWQGTSMHNSRTSSRWNVAIISTPKLTFLKWKVNISAEKSTCIQTSKGGRTHTLYFSWCHIIMGRFWRDV